VEDEKRIAYQGFNDGTVYPQKRGENYIYEGLILRFMKSHWQYQDATNVVGFFPQAVDVALDDLPRELEHFDPGHFTGDRVVIDKAMALNLARSHVDPCRTLWVFRYYDLDDRRFETYGHALVRLIGFVRDLAAIRNPGADKPKVNILAHSMGGLIVREAIQVTYPAAGQRASAHINKIVTLGTPHQGISFQLLRNWIKTDAEDELEHFSPAFQRDENRRARRGSYRNRKNPAAFIYFKDQFPLDRLLTVVGTNYRSYAVGVSTWLNRVFSVAGEGGPAYNRSDGLVKQACAEIPGAHRTFVHKCHGGHDSLVTSREAYEVATRFFFGNVRARLRLVAADVKRGGDWFGKSEFFFGVSIKPRRVDFELFHQSPDAENCYGPFGSKDLSDSPVQFDWSDPSTRLIWEGFLDTSKLMPDPERGGVTDMVLRMDVYVGERDTYGLGFSDNVIFRKQYYLRVVLDRQLALYRHTGEGFMQKTGDRRYLPPEDDAMKEDGRGWTCEVSGTGFTATLGFELDYIPEDGPPVPLREFMASSSADAAPLAGNSDMPSPPGEPEPGG
jgi:pimeloyl-ACP methyl ester carboxylesterase